MPYQEAFTVIAEVKPDAREDLERLLEEIGNNAARNTVLPFGILPELHFARLLVLPEATDLKGNVIPPKLVLSTNVDGSVKDHLNNLVDVVPRGLDQVFGHCVGYPDDTPIRGTDRKAYLEARMLAPYAFYVNTVGRTVRQVRDEDDLHAALQSFLDDERATLVGMKPSTIYDSLRRRVEASPNLRWALKPPKRPNIIARAKRTVGKIAWPIVFAAVGIAALPLMPFYFIGLRIKEKTDKPQTESPTIEHVRDVSAIEDIYVQNPFSGVGMIKAGLIRTVTARVGLRLLEYGARHIYNSGSLTGVTTIHFARWILIDDGRRVLFLSNYDGSLESYMSDFIDKVAWGLNLVFSNGVGWPRTRWLVLDGARREIEFKNFLRNHQIPTPVYYSAYPHLTAVNVGNNAEVRKGLTKSSMSDSEAAAWLKRF